MIKRIDNLLKYLGIQFVLGMVVGVGMMLGLLAYAGQAFHQRCVYDGNQYPLVNFIAACFDQIVEGKGVMQKILDEEAARASRGESLQYFAPTESDIAQEELRQLQEKTDQRFKKLLEDIDKLSEDI